MQTLALRSLALLSLVVSCTSPALARDECKNKTLKGSYILAAHGTKGPLSTGDRLAYAGMVVYDGKRNAAFAATYADGTEVTLRGPYMVQKSCKGEVVFEDGRKAVFYGDPSGDEAAYVLLSGPVVASTARRVTKDLLLDVDTKD
jgi:hypothetical protein